MKGHWSYHLKTMAVYLLYACVIFLLSDIDSQKLYFPEPISFNYYPFTYPSLGYNSDPLAWKLDLESHFWLHSYSLPVSHFLKLARKYLKSFDYFISVQESSCYLKDQFLCLLYLPKSKSVYRPKSQTVGEQ